MGSTTRGTVTTPATMLPPDQGTSSSNPNSKRGLSDFPRYLALLLCSVSALAGACYSPPEDERDPEVMAAPSADDTCIDLPAHAVPGDRCEERPSASCVAEPATEDAVALTLGALLTECFLNENRVHVEFEQGCATRFRLLIESPPGAVDCISAQLAAVRYDCLGDLSCGEAEASTVR